MKFLLAALLPAMFARGSAFGNLVSPSLTQVFDDGSSITTDDSTGAVTAAIDNQGNGIYVPPPEGSPIVQQFASLFQYGVRSAIDSTFRRSAGTSQAGTQIAGQPQTNAGLNLGSLKPLLLVAAGAWLLKKVL